MMIGNELGLAIGRVRKAFDVSLPEKKEIIVFISLPYDEFILLVFKKNKDRGVVPGEDGGEGKIRNSLFNFKRILNLPHEKHLLSCLR